MMKKVYQGVANVTVSQDKADDLCAMVGKEIEDYQNKGFQVEVQYQFSGRIHAALVLAYTEVSE